MNKACDLALEGGGVKGLGLIGAAYALENIGYRFRYLAGSSAGALVAALLASGFTAAEVKEVFVEIDYKQFEEKDCLDYFGTPGKLLSLGRSLGIYSANHFESFVNGLLKEKGISTFGDLNNQFKSDFPLKDRRPVNTETRTETVSKVSSSATRTDTDTQQNRTALKTTPPKIAHSTAIIPDNSASAAKAVRSTGIIPGDTAIPMPAFPHMKASFINNPARLRVTASDITDMKLLTLPDDLACFGIDPEKFSVATAVRISGGLPFFFEPYKLKDTSGRVHLLVDGGLISNYPIWILDDEKSRLDVPVFGLKFPKHALEPCLSHCKHNDRVTLFEYMKSVVSTLLDAHDEAYSYRTEGDDERAITIPTVITVDGERRRVGTADLGIKPHERIAMFENGVRAAVRFLKTWSFEKWLSRYR
ncbi:MAG: patatin-like phospholipase family protein [Clostridiaceae bacterium]|nr:patatin-like phospholipase family protein [Clostridiaceae bacterium]